jgi:hypothetical protein
LHAPSSSIGSAGGFRTLPATEALSIRLQHAVVETKKAAK